MPITHDYMSFLSSRNKLISSRTREGSSTSSFIDFCDFCPHRFQVQLLDTLRESPLFMSQGRLLDSSVTHAGATQCHIPSKCTADHISVLKDSWEKKDYLFFKESLFLPIEDTPKYTVFAFDLTRNSNASGDGS